MDDAMTEQEDAPRREPRRRTVLCPECRAFTWRVAYNLFDSKTGKVVYLFRCDCGQHIWDD